MNKINFYRQPTRNTCGPTCLRIILEYYNLSVQELDLIKESPLQNDGWNDVQFATAAFAYGFKTEIINLNLSEINNIIFPIVAKLPKHYIIIYRVKGNKIYCADPSLGKVEYTKEEFSQKFDIQDVITFLTLSKLPSFKQKGVTSSNISLIGNFFHYFTSFKAVIIKAFIVALVITIAQTILPFLTRSVIDVGLDNSAWDFIELLLAGNIILVFADIFGTFVHTYIITHVTNRVKYFMLDDYMRKILITKYGIFMSMKIGDLLQRVSDNERIQSFLSGACLSSLFAILYLVVFTITLFYFDYRLFLIYIVFSTLYMTWNIFFLKQRKKLDYNFWDIKSTSNKIILQVYNNIIDIKSFNSANIYIGKWKKNIFNLFKQNMSFFYYSQTQAVGANIIMQSKNLILTYVSCKLVFNGDMTLGTLFAIQYIIGTLNTPLYQISDFLNQFQLVMISLGRIHSFNIQPDDYNKDAIQFLPKSRDLYLRGTSYRYPDGTIGLQRINISLTHGKKYGIIGQSGCGKSTLLKTICGIIQPEFGEMWLGTTNIQSLSIERYRSIFSIDLQESKLFEGTILENIVDDLTNFDEDRLIRCVEIASIRREIECLPNSYNTLIEGDYRKLSRGQTQRVLIARAIYKKADIYIFDEIANCLNLEIEKKIVEKIDAFLSAKTRVYVSHRTESLVDCDMLYCMNNGTIFDIGNYNDLVNRKRI